MALFYKNYSYSSLKNIILVFYKRKLLLLFCSQLLLIRYSDLCTMHIYIVLTMCIIIYRFILNRRLIKCIVSLNAILITSNLKSNCIVLLSILLTLPAFGIVIFMFSFTIPFVPLLPLTHFTALLFCNFLFIIHFVRVSSLHHFFFMIISVCCCQTRSTIDLFRTHDIDIPIETKKMLLLLLTLFTYLLHFFFYFCSFHIH